MAFIDGNLETKFKETYDYALRAKQAGNLLVAKRKLEEAASILDQQVIYLTGSAKLEKKELAARIRKIAAAIVVPNAQEETKTTVKKASSSYEYDIEVENNNDMSSFFTFYSEEDLDVGFDSVIGLNEAKYAITEYVINPIKYKEAYHYNFQSSKNILLYGPPGTGKTTFAKALAKEISFPFALINVAALVNSYIGETAKNIDKVFKYLNQYSIDNNTSVIIFFDEFDEIAKKRNSEDKVATAAVPALLRNLDGVKKNKSFLILANTNCPDDLDPAILERFRQRILVDLPDFDSRILLFKQKLSDVEEDFLAELDFNKLSEVSEGLSGRRINNACDDFKYKLSSIQAGLSLKSDLTEIFVEIIKRN